MRWQAAPLQLSDEQMHAVNIADYNRNPQSNVLQQIVKKCCRSQRTIAQKWRKQVHEDMCIVYPFRYEFTKIVCKD